MRAQTIERQGVDRGAAGYEWAVTDYTEHGAAPVEDAAVADPPTVDEVLEDQRKRFPEQARTSTQQPPSAETGNS